MNNEIGYLSKVALKQNVEGATWVLLITYSKIREKTDELKKKLLGRKELDLKI